VGSDYNASLTAVPTTTLGTYYWRSIGLGTEVIAIEPSDPHACIPNPVCSYYIGVVGYRNNASFNILARSQDAAPTQLILGQPQVRCTATNRITHGQ